MPGRRQPAPRHRGFRPLGQLGCPFAGNARSTVDLRLARDFGPREQVGTDGGHGPLLVPAIKWIAKWFGLVPAAVTSDRGYREPPEKATGSGRKPASRPRKKDPRDSATVTRRGFSLRHHHAGRWLRNHQRGLDCQVGTDVYKFT